MTAESEYLKPADLQKRWRLSRPAFYRQLKKGYLPRPVYLAPLVPRWLRSEIEAFERRLMEERGMKAPEAAPATPTGEGGAP